MSSESSKESAKSSFWKKQSNSLPGSIKPVYGAQHPPLLEKQSRVKGKRRDAFQSFEENTADAWDDKDDDLVVSANIKLSLKDVQETAQRVLDTHQQTKQNQNCTSAPTTPLHMSSHRLNGPGLGVRQPATYTTCNVSQRNSSDKLKVDKFRSLLTASNLDIDELKTLSWSGIPSSRRPCAWKLLCGYLPLIAERREAMLERKRQEYYNFVEQYYNTRHEDEHQDTYRQIHIDIPRMCPLIALFQQPMVQEMFERILYIWAIRHPASGYVQGINDLVTPFFIVFLLEYTNQESDVEHFKVSSLSLHQRQMLEADSFWCFSKLLDGIQDNYTFAQPGIQGKVNALKELISRIDNNLHSHLELHHVEYLQFSFRWMNNLLMREVPLRCIVRLWDTYLSERDGFASFHLYVCAAFLIKFSQDLLRERDFHGLMLLLQNLPTQHWTSDDISVLVAEAYRLKFMFADAPKHLKDSR